jgi:hypothetical protein
MRELELKLLLALARPLFALTRVVTIAIGRRLPRDVGPNGKDRRTGARLGAGE